MGIASVPAGVLTGQFEAHSVPTAKAIENIKSVIGPNLIGQDATKQIDLDRIMIGLDPSPNREHLGSNSMLGVSLALARSGANALHMPLYTYLAHLYGGGQDLSKMPVPMFNILNGGAHADNKLPFQEFMIVPTQKEMSFSIMMEAGIKIFTQLKQNLINLGKSTAFGDEGGFAPVLNSDEEAIELLVESVQESGYELNHQFAIAIDIAANHIGDLSSISYPKDPLSYYKDLVEQYPIIMLEDPFPDNAWDSWKQFTSLVGNRVSIVGDDLFSTNLSRLKTGINEHAGNGISIKPNQIGTLTETLMAIKLAKESGFSVQVSHRSGETEDTFISDLAVATQSQFLKAGAPNRGERIAKYNRILRIESELRATAR